MHLLPGLNTDLIAHEDIMNSESGYNSIHSEKSSFIITFISLLASSFPEYVFVYEIIHVVRTTIMLVFLKHV